MVVPIDPGPNWDEVKDFCEAFANAMVAHSSEKYIASIAKAKREGKIFIDWLRNGRGATSVTSWSLRARPGAAVVVPLRWEELGRTQSSDQFNLIQAQQRALSLRQDPWAGIEKLLQKLP